MQHAFRTSVVGVVVGVLFLGGGCVGQTTGSAQHVQLPEGVVLNQGTPPTDCGDRNPNALRAYFSITDPDIVLGESITIDASCSVGRIASLQWDFDFEGWPDSTPSEQRFQPAIAIESPDLRSSSTERPPGGWPSNHLAPFYQIHLPRTSGTHTARLLATDHTGNQQLVIATYVVRDVDADSGQASALAPVRSRLIVFDRLDPRTDVVVPSVPEPSTTFIPFFSQSRMLRAYPFGSTGDIARYEWTVRQLGPQGGVVAQETDARPVGGALEQPAITVSLDAVVGQRNQTTAFGQRGQSSAWDRSGTPEQIVDASVHLKTVSQTGEEDATTHRFTVIDATTVNTLKPQLALIPESPTTFVEHGMENSAWTNDGMSLLNPGQVFALQNYSVYAMTPLHVVAGAGKIGQVIPERVVEMDPGTGIYETIATLPAVALIPEYAIQVAPTLADAYRRANVAHTFTAPTREGQYTARLRVTQAEIPGIIARQRAEAAVSFRIRAAAPLRAEIAAYPPSGVMGQEVTFDAGASTGNIGQYIWQVDQEPMRHAYARDPHDPHASAQWKTTFILPKTHDVTLEIVEAGTIRRASKTIAYTVRPAPIPTTPQSLPQTSAQPLPTLVPEVFAENRNGVRMTAHPEIYEDDAIVLRLNGLTMAVKTVEWDLRSDGRERRTCTNAVIPSGLQCTFYRIVSYRTPPGNYVAHVRVVAADSTDTADYIMRYTVIRGSRPADRHS